MEGLTKEKTIELHRKLWNYIADESEKQGRIIEKIDAFDHFGWDKYISFYCWCCEYDDQHNQDCSSCPIKWPGGRCTMPESPYTIYRNCNYDFLFWHDKNKENVEKAVKAAREIANLPEKT